MRFQHTLFILAGLAVAVGLTACNVDTPSVDAIRDSKYIDRRIKETPRQKIIRECKQESDRFRVGCLNCHTTDKINDIKSPDNLALNKVGERTQIMRTSPSFGLNQDCAACHQSKFQLNRNAEKLFGPGGARYSESQKSLQPDK